MLKDGESSKIGKINAEEYYDKNALVQNSQICYHKEKTDKAVRK